MKSKFKTITYCALCMTMCIANYSCVNNGSTKVEASDSDSDKIATAKDTLVKNNEASSSSFDGVTKWEITLTSIYTIIKECTADEAMRINDAGGDDWAQLDETTGKWMKHCESESVTGVKEVSDPRYVQQLNTMMQQDEYDAYASEVQIKDGTAKAKWYSGNRGGGISDDFPIEVAQFLLN